MATAKKTADKHSPKKSVVTSTFSFDKGNYIAMVVGLIIIFVGFVLMAGKEDIFGFTKLTLAPIIVLIGFSVEIYAIMRKPRS